MRRVLVIDDSILGILILYKVQNNIIRMPGCLRFFEIRLNASGRPTGTGGHERNASAKRSYRLNRCGSRLEFISYSGSA